MSTSKMVETSQVYDVWEEGAVQDGLQALRERQRIDIETGGGRHVVKVGGCRKQRLGGAGSCLREEGVRRELSGAKHEWRAAKCFCLLGSCGVVTGEEPPPPPPAAAAANYPCSDSDQQRKMGVGGDNRRGGGGMGSRWGRTAEHTQVRGGRGR
jgi:hypothetical protein